MMKRKTKIICTIGPASSSEEMLKKLVVNGMDAARLNFSHGDYESHKAVIDKINKIRNELNVPLPIILDTKGPEFRTGDFKDGRVEIKEGSLFSFYTDDRLGDEKGVSVSYKNLAKELKKGSSILVNNGLSIFEVIEVKENELVCISKNTSILSNKKSMNFPGNILKQEFLSDKDKSDLLFGIENDIDFVAASFVSTKADVEKMRAFLDENGGKGIQIIAKLENRSGVDNAKEILEIADGIMVARGDLGVEVPYTELPSIQKKLIKTALKEGGISVTATEMLESMIEKPRPTRAEISDVANAVFDGTSAIMLSGETASGRYPDLAVKAMSDIAYDAELHTDYASRFRVKSIDISNLTDALSHSAGQLALDTNAKCIVVTTTSGFTARMLERCRVPIPVIGTSRFEKTYRQMALYWNTSPMLVCEYNGIEEIIKHCSEILKEEKLVQKGDVVIVTGGLKNKVGGTRFLNADVIE